MWKMRPVYNILDNIFGILENFGILFGRHKELYYSKLLNQQWKKKDCVRRQENYHLSLQFLSAQPQVCHLSVDCFDFATCNFTVLILFDSFHQPLFLPHEAVVLNKEL